jgi:hypothetical protein
MLFSFRRWARAMTRPTTAATSPKPRSRPSLLALEDRVVPTNIGGAAYFAVATAPGVTTQVNVYDNATGALVNTLTPFGTHFKLGANVAVGDVNGDGFQDIIVGAGPGADPLVIVYSGAPADGMFVGGTPRVLKTFYPYFNSASPDAAGHAFPGGVFVAAGDVNGDGFDDIITGAGAAQGAAPQVRVFSGANLGAVNDLDPTSQSGVLLNFFAGFASNFHGGVRVAAGDLGGDGTTAEIVATAGPGGASQTIAYSTQRPGDPPTGALQPTLLGQFFAFPISYSGGSNVAVGALTNNNAGSGPLFGDIIVSKSTGSPEIRVFRLLDATNSHTVGSTIIGPNFTFTASLTTPPVMNQFANIPNVDFTANFGPTFQGGSTVAVFHAGAVTATSSEFDAVNLLVGAGAGGTPVVYTFSNNSLSDGQQTTSQPPLASPASFAAFDQTFHGGVTVG